MNADRGREASDLLRQALAKKAEERAGFLDQVGRERPALRAEVERLLAEAEEGETLLAEAEELPTQIAPAVPDAYQLTGTTVAQYEIGERLGKGGMGVVYKAKDTRLHRTVALKFLRLSLSEEEQARERFFTEARSASALDHNNICTVHEFGETADGGVFIVMGYYEGQDLAAKTRAGPLAMETALDYGQQIASGLAAAHDKGIVHRDLKPANIMVTSPEPGAEHGVLKILDFGLAKIEGIELTRTGTTMGTLAYMSPEQARGERVDQRSDIWSLGVILYEMLTGQRPFRADNELAILQALANEEIVPLRRINAEVPEELERVVLNCLCKDKEGRYSDAKELLSDLRGIYMATVSQTLTGSVIGAVPALEKPARRWLSPIGVAVTALLLIALVLVIPATRQLVLGPPSGAPPRGSRLMAVLPFVNGLGATADNQALTDGLSYSLTSLATRLGTSDESLWIVPASEIFQQGIATAGDAVKQFGVDIVLTGSVQRTGADIEIILNVVDPTSKPPRTVDSRVLIAPLSPAQRDRTLGELAGLLGVEWTLAPGDGETAPDSTSGTAYTLYLQGMGYLQRRDLADGAAAAERTFELVLEQDPEYGPAYAGLCEALWASYRQREDAEIAKRAALNCERAAALSGDQAAVLVSVGRSYLEMGELRRARTELDKALALEPDNAEAHRWSGWVAVEAGRPEQAVASFESAVVAEPGLWLYPNDFGELLIMLGRPEEAAEQLERALRLTPDNYVAMAMLGVARSKLGEDDEASNLLERSLALEPNSLAYRNLGLLRFRQGRYDEAVESMKLATELAGVTPYSNDWVVWSLLAHAYYWAGDRPAAEQTWRRLIEVAQARYEVNPKEALGLAFLSESHAALGESERARFYLSRLLAVPLESRYIYFLISRTYEMLGDRELALSYVGRALEERFDPWAIDGDPWLADLRSETEYQTLRQQYMPSGN